MSRSPELLMPAGDAECLAFALAYGADAVYLAPKEFGMRSSSENFTQEQIEAAAMECHRRGKACYLTLNTLPTNEELARLPATVEGAAAAGVDAFIVADLGVLDLVQARAPQVAVHFSTQAGVSNYGAARRAHSMGASRVVLARELSLEDIAAIRAKTPPELELEAFVHGSMCMSVSGRCLLSNVLAGRDANRGQCAQSCRWSYHLVEEKRPGEFIPIGEDEKGSFILNADDLCAAPFLDEVLAAGVDSLKVEGRAKSFYYVASVAAAYRRALDAALAAPPGGYECPAFTLAELERTSHRPFSPGFYKGRAGATQSPYKEYQRDWQVVGVVEGAAADGWLRCRQRGKLTLGEEVELLTPAGEVYSYTPGALRNEEGAAIPAAPHAKMLYEVPPPAGVKAPALSLLRRRNAPPKSAAPRSREG